MKVVALATCHNRCVSTIRALAALHEMPVPKACQLEICLVDDGCSDGTSEAVRDSFPQVNIARGSGELYWAGGMRFGWQTYVAHRDIDYLLVFNDDVVLYEYALLKLMDTMQALESQGHSACAVSGALADPVTGKVSYGGVIRSSWWHPLRFKKIEPSETPQHCDTINMNFALINRAAIDMIGFLDPTFVHAKADYDFGLRLRAHGGVVALAPGFIGECRPNPLDKKSTQPGLRFSERWRRLTDIKEQSPRERAVYYRRHAGLLWPVLWAMPYCRACVESGLAFFWDRLRFKR